MRCHPVLFLLSCIPLYAACIGAAALCASGWVAGPHISTLLRVPLLITVGVGICSFILGRVWCQVL